MRLIAAAIAVAAALSAPAGAQETKPVPKDSMRVNALRLHEGVRSLPPRRRPKISQPGART